MDWTNPKATQRLGHARTITQRICDDSIVMMTYVSTLPLSGVNSSFCSAIPLSRFPLKRSRFFAYFELEKMRCMRSAQRQVELTRLGNQFPMLGKSNSLCKIVKMLCVLPQRLSPGAYCPG